MKNQFITKPKVYLIGKQVVNDSELKKFLDDEGLAFTTDTNIPAEVLSETAGRLCYMSFGKGRKTNKEYLENILSSHHGSVLEHTVWNFLITGVSRSLTHELVRHRAGFGFSQLSQRFVDESDARYVIPLLYQQNETLKKKWLAAIEAAHETYCELAEETQKYVNEHYKNLDPTEQRKLVRQTARSVLPNATETKIFVTANGRAWRHFVEMRGSIHADVEIRQLAIEIARVLKREAPNVFQDVEIVKEADGTETVKVRHLKV